MAQGYSVLFEGAQATLLDIDHGTYPFVTSSSARPRAARSPASACRPTRIDGVHRHRQGLHHARGRRARCPPRSAARSRSRSASAGSEFGASTGRPRRCGWFDAVVVRYSVRVNGFDSLALTKLDVLDELAEIQVCTGYRFEGETLTEFPADLSVLEGCEPVYETLPGWRTPTAGVARLRDAARGGARATSSGSSELVGAEIGIVSTGPDRDAHDRPRRERASRAGSSSGLAPRATITSGARRNAGGRACSSAGRAAAF